MRASTELFRNGQSYQIRLVKPILDVLHWQHQDDLMAEVADNTSLRLQSIERYVRDRVATGTTAVSLRHATAKILKSGSSLHVTIPKRLLEALTWNDRAPLILETDLGEVLRVQTLERYLEEEIAADRQVRRAGSAGAGA